MPSHRPRGPYTRTRPAIVAANTAATLALLAVCAAVLLTATPPGIDPSQCHIVRATTLECG